jgi:hypothetical protein
MNNVFLYKEFCFHIKIKNFLPGISRRRSFKNLLFVCKRIKRRISTGHVLNSVFPVYINSAIYFPIPPASPTPVPFAPDATK